MGGKKKKCAYLQGKPCKREPIINSMLRACGTSCYGTMYRDESPSPAAHSKLFVRSMLGSPSSFEGEKTYVVLDIGY